MLLHICTLWSILGNDDAFAPLCYHGIGATSFLTGFVRISSEKLFRIGIGLFHLGVGLFGLGITFGAGFFSRRLFDMGFGSFFGKFCIC